MTYQNPVRFKFFENARDAFGEMQGDGKILHTITAATFGTKITTAELVAQWNAGNTWIIGVTQDRIYPTLPTTKE